MAIGTAAAIIGGSIISGAAGSRSASKAAKAQAKGQEAGIAEQRRQFDITQQSLAPFQSAGTAALEQQRILLGLGGTDPSSQQRTDLQSQLEAINQEEKFFSDKFGGKTTGRAGLINRAGMELSGKQNFDQQRSDIQSQLDALPEFSPGTAQEQQQAAFDQLAESPGQQFLRDRAQKNLLRGAASIGGLGGGRVRTALVEQGVGFAQQDLQNRFGRLGQLAGQGQAAATNVGQFGAQTAGRIQQGFSNIGEARSTGIMGRNQALQAGISGITTGLGQSGLFDSSGGTTLPAANIDPFARVA